VDGILFLSRFSLARLDGSGGQLSKASAESAHRLHRACLSFRSNVENCIYNRLDRSNHSNASRSVSVKLE